MPPPSAALSNADTIKFAVLTYDYSISAPFYDKSGTTQLVGICLSKFPGTLDFKLNGQDLGFSYDVDIIFHGKDLGTDAQGRSLVQWSVQENPNKYFPKQDFNLDSIKGILSTTVVALSPALSSGSCDGSSRAFTAHLEATSASNYLDIQGHRNLGTDLAPINVSGTLHVKNLYVFADSGERTALEVKIAMLRKGGDQCTVIAVCGHTINLSAEVTGLPVGGNPPTYNWLVTGAVIQGPDNQSKVAVTLPATPVLVTISVSVNIVPDTASATMEFTPFTPEEAARLQAICEFFQKMKHLSLQPNPFYDPGDPVPLSRETLVNLTFLNDRVLRRRMLGFMGIEKNAATIVSLPQTKINIRG